jgi:polar amino acid transport system substrate-binding protein
MAALAVLTLASCVSEPQDNAQPFHSVNGRTLCVATDLPAPGFWQGSAKHPTGGFEYELSLELAHRFGLSGIHVVSASRSQLDDGVPSGCDLAIAEITITSERQQRMTFSTPYYTTSLGVLTRAGTSVPDMYTAQSKSWGSEAGSRGADFVQDTIQPDTAVKTFANFDYEVQAVRDKVVDCVLDDLPLTLIAAKSDPALDVAAQFRVNDNYGIVVADADNLDAVNVSLRDMSSDGTIDDLIDQWLAPRFEEQPADVSAISFDPQAG